LDLGVTEQMGVVTMRRALTIAGVLVVGLLLLAGPAAAQADSTLYPIEVRPIEGETGVLPGVVVPVPPAQAAEQVISAAPGQLAATGLEISVGVLLAALLLVAGVAALVVARRRAPVAGAV
jgi:hypothetical protein